MNATGPKATDFLPPANIGANCVRPLETKGRTYTLLAANREGTLPVVSVSGDRISWQRSFVIGYTGGIGQLICVTGEYFLYNLPYRLVVS